jgi:dTDP-4-amino-4,6-dideoxygalactose transaminase
MSVSDLERHTARQVIIEHYVERGYNYRMTDIQASIGIVQMRKLPKILEKRRSIATRYNEAFSAIPCLRVPASLENCVPNYQSYWLEVLETSPLTRNDLMQCLLEKGISTRRGIMAIHREPCYDTGTINLPHTERIMAQTLIFPLYPAMTTEEVDYAIHAVRDILG